MVDIEKDIYQQLPDADLIIVADGMRIPLMPINDSRHMSLPTAN